MRGHRLLTQEQKGRAVEMALAGENPLPYLKECGASNPSASWNYIRKAAILEHPEKAEQLKQPLPANRPKVDLVYDPEIAEEYNREQAQKAANAEAREKAAEKCTVPLTYDGFQVTAIKGKTGEFQYNEQTHSIRWTNQFGIHIVTMTPECWKMLEEEIPRIMKILGVEV